MSAFYIASKLFTYLFLPPGIFIVLFVLASLFAKKLRLFFVSFAVIFYLFSISPISDLLLKPLESPYNNKHITHKNIDGVVALAGGSIKGSANLPLYGDAFKRASYGLMLAKKENLPLLFSGGGNEDYKESQAFLDTLEDFKDHFNISADLSDKITNKFSIVIEENSLDTFQNGKFSKKIFKKNDIKDPKIYLVTSAYHMKRSKILYESFGFSVIPAATDFKVSKNKEYSFWSFFPNIHSFQKSYIALHEYCGILSLYLRNTETKDKK